MPRGLSMEDQMMFLSLRMLYHQVRIGLISRDAGIAEKKKLVGSYNEAKRLNAFGEKCREHSVLMWKELEQLQSQFRKAPSMELAYRIVDALDGKLTSGPEGPGAGGGEG